MYQQTSFFDRLEESQATTPPPQSPLSATDDSSPSLAATAPTSTSITEIESIAHFSIETFNFPVRIENALKKAKIETVGQLARLTDEELLQVENFGPQSLGHVRRALANVDFDSLDSLSQGESAQAEDVTPVTPSTPKLWDIPADLADLSLGVLALSVRTENRLKRASIRTLADLAQLDLPALQSMKNLGKKSIQDIEEAISKLLSNHLRASARRIDNPPEEATQEPIAQETATLPLRVLNLSSRSLNTLQQANIETVGQLASYSDQELLYLKHFGPQTLKEVRKALSAIDPDGLLQVTTTEPQRTKKGSPSASKLWDVPPDLAGLSIRVLALSKRCQRALEAAGVWTLGDLGQLRERQLKLIQNLGKKSQQEIRQTISNLSPADLRAKLHHRELSLAVRIPLILTSLPAQIQQRLNDQIKDVAQLCQVTKEELSLLGLSAGEIREIEEMLKSHSLQLATPLLDRIRC